MQFRQLFKMWLGAADITRSQAAIKLGCTKDTINNYICGRSHPPQCRYEYIMNTMNNDIEEAYERWKRNNPNTY